MRLPSFTELLDEQKNVFFRNPDDSILVVGPPGSGKTSTALWKARVLSGEGYARSVTVVTRNRLLAALATQISQDHGGVPVQSTTMATLLSQDYHSRFGHFVPQYPPFNYLWDKIIPAYAQAQVQPSIDHLIVDEGQNLPAQFFVWARYIARAVSVFADENQTTDGQGCQIADLQQAGFNVVLPLTINHRNTQEIADLVEQFHVRRFLPHLPAKRGRSYDAPRLVPINTWNALAEQVAARFRNRAESIGVILFHQNDIEHMAALMRSLLVGVRVDCYTSKLEPQAEDAILMREPGITILSGESATGLEFETVFLQDLARSLPFQSDLDYRRLYMLCARARDALVLVNGPSPLNEAQLRALPQSPILER